MPDGEKTEMSAQIQFIDQLKVGQGIKTKKPHGTIVNGTIEHRCLPRITIPQEIRGQISYISNFSGEFHIKWVELEVETIEFFDSSVFETLEFEE